jgi:broad specificity polyphosphatase/5'/3'-nucleotidase SurE
MKLLLSNDDGVFASGIIALASELGKNHEVFIPRPIASAARSAAQ